MVWKPILVGVDTSAEAAQAAALGQEIAHAAGTSCHLVHAAADAWTVAATVAAPEHAQEFSRSLLAEARQAVLGRLWGAVAAETADALSVEPGKAPVVLRAAATRLGAEVIIVGGKHHGVVGRWVHGSTAHALVRTASVPVLVAVRPTPPERVLVAVDLSAAALPTIDAAVHYAALGGGALRALSVIEPLPVIPEIPMPYRVEDYYQQASEQLEATVWPHLAPAVERQVRYGMAVETILREANEWAADLVVLGSHGRGWAERAILGSVTERLLGHLPTSVLVVPAYAAVVAGRGRALEAHANWHLAPV